jgi:hypothetical protein
MLYCKRFSCLRLTFITHKIESSYFDIEVLHFIHFIYIFSQYYN